MPYYDYHCKQRGDFALRRSLADRHNTAECMQCGQPSERKTAFTPALLRSKPVASVRIRSEEQSVGSECCLRWSPVHLLY